MATHEGVGPKPLTLTGYTIGVVLLVDKFLPGFNVNRAAYNNSLGKWRHANKLLLTTRPGPRTTQRQNCNYSLMNL